MASTSAEYHKMDIPLIAIYGYARSFGPGQSAIPEAILSVIHSYAVQTFEWDTYLNATQYHIAYSDRSPVADCNKQLHFSNEGRTIESGSCESNYYCPSINVLSADIHQFVEWEVEMERGYLFCIGFVEYPFYGYLVESDEWNYWLGNEPYDNVQFGLSVDSDNLDNGFELGWKKYSDTSWNLVGSKGKHIIIESAENKGDITKDGNTFGIHFDFVEKKASFYFNGEPIKDAVYNDIPLQVLPVMVIVNGHRFTTTKWKCYYLK